MKTTIILCYLLAGLVVLTVCESCESKTRKVATFYDSDDDDDDDDDDDIIAVQEHSVARGEEVIVPFTEKGGVKMIDVKVNGVGLEMIFDTGCSTALISLAEARYMYTKGTLTANDFLGIAQSQIADGSVVEDMMVNLREVIIGGKLHCYNVPANVSASIDAPLLIGNGVLDNVESYTIDNVRKTINFKIK